MAALSGAGSAEQLPPEAVRDSYFGPLRERLLAYGAKPNEEGALWAKAVCRYRTDAERIRRMLPPHLEPDFGRYAGRAGQMLRKKDGLVNIDISGNKLRAWTTRKGRLLSAMETEVADEPAHPMYWMREVGW